MKFHARSNWMVPVSSVIVKETSEALKTSSSGSDNVTTINNGSEIKIKFISSEGKPVTGLIIS